MPPVDANKAIASGMAGAVTTVLVYLVGQFHVTIPAEVATAITTIIGTAAVYIVPHTRTP